jgi:sulfur relay (sulfurtransferase) DsrC/TusE family protein
MEVTIDTNIIISAIAVSVVAVIVFAFSSWLSKKRLDSSHSELISLIDRNESEIEKIKDSKNTQLAEAVDQKKEYFLNIPNISFHFANKEEVRSFYNDYFKEPTIEQVVAEMTSELGSEVKGTLPKVIEAKIGGKDLSKWISTIKLPEISDAAMFRRYQRETIKNNQVTLGLELLDDVDLSDLNAFTKLLSELETKFGLKIDGSKISSQNADLKNKAAEKTLVRLENATGSVLIEGKFKILKQSNDYYKCVYEHPVNEYLVGVDKTITISLILKISLLEPNISGNYALSLEKSIPLKVYGKVWQPIDRKADVWELQITPLAVY